MNYQEIPDVLFNNATRHMLSVAHQDDEIQYCGLISRWGPGVRFLFMTNGDGIAPFVNADPLEYAEMRKEETDSVLKTLGRDLEDRVCLDYSEIEIYDNFVELTLNPTNKPAVIDFMHRIACDVYRDLKAFRPDVVWCPQFQNGHPEHDLIHILTAYAIRQINREEGCEIKFYQLPEYEYTILIPMRFHPLYKGPVHFITLTEEEMEIKRRAFECYPSQVELFAKFERVMNGIGTLGKLIGRGFSAEDFLKREHFAPVPTDIDYTRSFHRFEWANYMFDKNKDVKVRFDRHIAVIARELSGRSFE